MNIFLKVLLFIFVVYGIVSIIYTLYLKIRCLINHIIDFKNKIKNLKQVRKQKPEGRFLNSGQGSCIKKYIIKSLVINSQNKLAIIIYFMSFCIIFIVPKERYENVYIQVIISICIIITFYGVAKFISYRRKYYSLVDELSSYVLKFLIFILYSTVFFMSYLSKMDNNILFMLAIFMLLIYSICFLKYVIDNFNSFIFLMINLIFIYLYDLLMLGSAFGFFYLNNNNIYALFQNSTDILNEATIKNYTIIFNKGLHYFYTYSPIMNTNNWFYDCMPFFEYLFAATFNIAIVGFFISYTASKAFARTDCNTKDIDILEQLKNKEIKISLKKIQK